MKVAQVPCFSRGFDVLVRVIGIYPEKLRLINEIGIIAVARNDSAYVVRPASPALDRDLVDCLYSGHIESFISDRSGML